MENSRTDFSTAIEQIKELAVAGVKAETKEIDGRFYLVGTKTDGTPTYKEIVKEDNTRYPSPMNVNTLNALVSYIVAGIKNGEIEDKLYINVETPTRVSVYTPVNEYGRRKEIACAQRYSLRGFDFGIYYGFEEFVVSLRSKFIDDGELQGLLSTLKTITSSNEIVTEDNGVVQSVVAKQGTKLGATQVSPVWRLRPFRTFTEIAQPESLFLLRLVNRGDKTEYALHETDGGEWSIRAMTEIRDYIADTLFAAMGDAEKYGEKVFVL